MISDALPLQASVLTGMLLVAAVFADDPQGTVVTPGGSIDLLKAWPEIAKAPKSDLATIECLIRPDATAIDRPRSFVITLSNNGGNDVAGLGFMMKQGTVRANVFGTYLESNEKLPPDKWSHVALTVNTKTINKQARLWINGELAADELVLEPWPQSFEVAEMLSDKWNLGRVFSGQVGDVRISRIVCYQDSFEPPSTLAADEQCAFRLDGSRIPLD
ncbi:MAG: hypothetical protein CMJ64_19500 [Planctomycetaceae bacterium]|nr:hypothetical protein [Planctomycetaceae bacterium]